MTFSLVARRAETRMLSMAISSFSPAVAARCAYAHAAVGAVASQNITDPTSGPKTLDHMAQGLSAPEAVNAAVADAAHVQYRQLLAVDAMGRMSIHSGSNVFGNWNEARGVDVASGGNLLDSYGVSKAIVAGFEMAQGHLGDRLIAAMRAGLAAGGEAGPVHLAGLLLVDKVSWLVAEMRCEWAQVCPIETIATAWDTYKPQLDDYVRLELGPSQAPSYGVPGDR